MDFLVGNMVGTAIDHSIRKNLHSGDSLSERETHSGYSSLWTTVKGGTHTVGTATYGQSIRKGNIHSGDSLSERAIHSGYSSLWTTVKKGNSHSGDSSICLRVLPPALAPGRPSGRHEDTCRIG